jgi:hypothetical protein
MAVVILHTHTQGAQDFLHDLDVGDGGQVFERDRFVGRSLFENYEWCCC